MKVIDMFTSVAGQILDDGQIQKYGAMLLTRGATTMTKLSPAVVWVDAAIAVIEAAGAHFRYCAACEIAAQLRECNRVLEITLTQDLKLAGLELETLGKERKRRRAQIERSLQTARGRALLTQRKIRNQLDLLKKMHALLQQQRLQSGGFQTLIGLQSCLDSCIDATLTLILNPTGE